MGTHELSGWASNVILMPKLAAPKPGVDAGVAPGTFADLTIIARGRPGPTGALRMIQGSENV